MSWRLSIWLADRRSRICDFQNHASHRCAMMSSTRNRKKPQLSRLRMVVFSIFSARSFAFKAGASLASVFTGLALDLIEFPRGAPAGEVASDVVFRLGLVAGPITSVIGLAILLFYLSYRLDRKRVAEIQLELNARRQSTG